MVLEKHNLRKEFFSLLDIKTRDISHAVISGPTKQNPIINVYKSFYQGHSHIHGLCADPSHIVSGSADRRLESRIRPYYDLLTLSCIPVLMGLTVYGLRTASLLRDKTQIETLMLTRNMFAHIVKSERHDINKYAITYIETQNIRFTIKEDNTMC